MAESDVLVVPSRPLPDGTDDDTDLSLFFYCAAGMEPERLKRKFGERLSFWGGAIDSQHVLPSASPVEVEEHPPLPQPLRADEGRPGGLRGAPGGRGSGRVESAGGEGPDLDLAEGHQERREPLRLVDVGGPVERNQQVALTLETHSDRNVQLCRSIAMPFQPACTIVSIV